MHTNIVFVVQLLCDAIHSVDYAIERCLSVCNMLIFYRSNYTRGFEIRFEFESDIRIRFKSDRPIQKFRIATPATFAVVP